MEASSSGIKDEMGGGGFVTGLIEFVRTIVRIGRRMRSTPDAVVLGVRGTGRPRRCSASTTRPPTPPTRPAAPVTRMGCVIVFPFDFARLFRWPCRTMDTPWPSCPLLTRFPGLAKRPERNPEQGQVLDEELPRAIADRAGKPPRLGSQTPGVVTRKLRVVRNIPTARALRGRKPEARTGGRR